MCEDVGHGHWQDEPALSRRSLLKAVAVAPGVVGAMEGARGLRGAGPAAALRTAPRVASAPGSYSMAMHVHSSFSEMWGSMEGHLNQAQLNGIDVVWWTDHDSKMDGTSVKHVVHFSSLQDETGDGAAWQWQRVQTGAHTTASTGGIVSSPVSPVDPDTAGSLQVVAQSTGTAPAMLAYQPADVPAHQTWRTNVTQQTIQVEALPTAVSSKAYLEIYLGLSHHPASGGRPAGRYSLSYRIGGGGRPGTRSASGLHGIVRVDTTPNQWNSLTLSPQDDLAALYPDLDARDFSIFSLRFGAVSADGATASGFFDYLRFNRGCTGEVALQTQDDIATRAASKYPAVTSRRGLEISHGLPHINWFGGTVTIPSYEKVTKKTYYDYLRHTVVPDIHASGGLASYNHPYGTSWGPLLSTSAQDSLLRQTALLMLPNRAAGTDILEVGYPSRGGVHQSRHLGLWDVMSRNAIFLTGNGVSDDHTAIDYRKPSNKVVTWTTSVWAPDNSEASLLQALRAGRAWCQSLVGYSGGAIDVSVDGTCPMGSVSVSTLTSRQLSVTALAVPAGGSVAVVQGAVDYAGTAQPVPTAAVVATLPAGSLSAGRAVLTLDTRVSSFVRVEVRNAVGECVGLSNPIWLLREKPAAGIPAARAA